MTSLLEATPGVIKTMDLMGTYGQGLVDSFLNKRTKSTVAPLDPILVTLLQPISEFESGMGEIMTKSTSPNCFIISMYGYFVDSPTYSIKIRVNEVHFNSIGNAINYSEILTTGNILTENATNETVQQAILATGKVANTEIDVSFGNLINSGDLINNKATRYREIGININTPASKIVSHIGTWHLNFKGARLNSKSLSIELLNSAGVPLDQEAIRSVISQKTILEPTGITEEIFDVFGMSRTGPLIGGCLALCVFVSNFGYCVMQTKPREFDQ